MDNIKKHIPNILTTLRLIMALLMPLVFLYTPLTFTLGYFLIGDITDALDGFLARKWKVQSKYGKIIDPFADKLFNGLTLLFTSVFVNPLLFLLTGFEAAIAGISIFRISKKRDINVSQVGRIKTIVLFFTIIMSLIQPLMLSLTLLLNSLIAATAILQGVTTYKYLKECYQENKLDKYKKVDNKEIDEKQKIIEELKAKKKELEKEKRKETIDYLAGTTEKPSPFKYENSESNKEIDDSNEKSRSK